MEDEAEQAKEEQNKGHEMVDEGEELPEAEENEGKNCKTCINLNNALIADIPLLPPSLPPSPLDQDDHDVTVYPDEAVAITGRK